jgi:hypothetical protein
MNLALRKAQEDCTESYLLTEGLKLERELNAANDRIKRLEEAGNNLLWNFYPEYTSDLTQEQSAVLKRWNKAKEAKP